MKTLLENLAFLLIVLAIIAAFVWVIAFDWEKDPLSCGILWGFNLVVAIELYRGNT